MFNINVLALNLATVFFEERSFDLGILALFSVGSAGFTSRFYGLRFYGP